jgi:dTDP-6-deoxy-L-talose 4-dehydrogenase (NAD+)
MPRLLVTGATGFVGNHVVKALLARGYSVIASSSSVEKARTFDWFSAVQYIPFNLGQPPAATNYYSYFDKPEGVIHLAWEGLPNYKAPFHNEVNLPRHFAFLENLVAHGLNDLTVTGTCFEYGLHEGQLSEDMDATPANAYAMAKDSLRRLLQGLQQKHSFDLKWIRLFYMYGPGQNPNSLLSQLQKVIDEGTGIFNMSGGAQVRDYLPIETVADYIVSIATQRKVSGIINCCSGKPITVRKLVEEYLASQHASVHLNLGHYPYADYEPMSFWGDDKKLNQIIGSIEKR